MTDANNQANALTYAIYEALMAAQAVAVAMSAAEAEITDELSDHDLCQIEDLLCGDLTPNAFTKESISILRDLAAILETKIVEETITWVVVEECDLSDGYRETSTSARGQALTLLRSSLCDLANRMSDVVNLQEAERLTGRMAV